LSSQAVKQLKLRLLDSIGCTIAVLGQGPTEAIREHARESCPQGKCTLVGGGQRSPDLAALYNGALIRYLDFNDSYLAKGEMCHPSDNIAAVLAAAEYSNADGKDFLTGLAAAYQVQCRLPDIAPVRLRDSTISCKKRMQLRQALRAPCGSIGTRPQIRSQPPGRPTTPRGRHVPESSRTGRRSLIRTCLRVRCGLYCSLEVTLRVRLRFSKAIKDSWT